MLSGGESVYQKINGLISEFLVGYPGRYKHNEGCGSQRLKPCNKNNKDAENSPNINSVKNYECSSSKFRQKPS